MTTNILSSPASLSLSGLFQTLGVPPRLEILLAVGEGEACVCHLEAALGYRQAYISQHLMALREANLLESRRDGRFIYYKLTDRRVLDVLARADEILGQATAVRPINLANCECPNCATITVQIQETPFSQVDDRQGEA